MTETVDISQLSIRKLKKMRKFARKRRDNPLHKHAFKVADRAIKKKQAKYYEIQKEAFTTLLFKKMNQLLKRK